ncbi:hypothetical protein TNCV_2361871 [Trichonephila clavipes]|nr:hypothetical protein TNCV_2361871 [Trichonephila clavipes]
MMRYAFTTTLDSNPSPPSENGIPTGGQEWVDNVRFQHHEVNGLPRATADREDRLIVRSAVTAPDSSLSTLDVRPAHDCPSCPSTDG